MLANIGSGGWECTGGGAIFGSHAVRMYVAPIVPQLFLGHSARELNRQIIEYKAELVGAQGIEPWTSPV